MILEGADFAAIERQVLLSGVNIAIGHSGGRFMTERHGIPGIRAGFPVHDRVGGQRILSTGVYRARSHLSSVLQTPCWRPSTPRTGSGSAKRWFGQTSWKVTEMQKPRYHIFVCTSSRANGQQKGFCHSQAGTDLMMRFVEEIEWEAGDRGRSVPVQHRLFRYMRKKGPWSWYTRTMYGMDRSPPTMPQRSSIRISMRVKSSSRLAL